MIKKRFSEKLKGQKGSITLFVLISIIFFLIVLISIYISSGNKEQSQVSEIKTVTKKSLSWLVWIKLLNSSKSIISFSKIGVWAIFPCLE